MTRLSNPVVICNEIIAILNRELAYQRGCIVLSQGDAASNVLVAHCHGDRDPRDHMMEIMRVQGLLNRPDPGVIARVIASGKPIIVGDVAAEAAYHSGAPTIRSEACVPLISLGAVIGALNVESEQPFFFDEEDELLLTTVAALIADRLARLPLRHLR